MLKDKLKDKELSISLNFLTPLILSSRCNFILNHSDVDGVLRSANLTEYGLASGVFTNDLSKVRFVMRRFNTVINLVAFLIKILFAQI